MSATLLRKLSAKNIMGGKVEAPEKPVDLYTIIGIATGVKSGTTTYGMWHMLTGQFEATRVDTGEVFTSGGAFLPEPLNDMICAQLLQKDKDGNRVTDSAQFSVMVSIKPADNAFKYEYVARQLAEVEQADPLASLRADTVKLLAAPAEKEPAKKGK